CPAIVQACGTERPHETVGTADGNQASGRAYPNAVQRRAQDTVLLDSQRRDLPSHNTSVAAAGPEVVVIGPVQPESRTVMGHGISDELGRFGIPETETAITSYRRQQIPPRRESHRVHRAAMPAEFALDPKRDQILVRALVSLADSPPQGLASAVQPRAAPQQHSG